jgi:hypothetical protein
MAHKIWAIHFFFFLLACPGIAQKKKIDEKKFFMDERPVQMKLSTDIRSLLLEKTTLNYVNASIHCVFPDSAVAEGKVQIKPRGHFRKDNCRLTPLTVNFKNEGAPAFSKLGTLKLVVGCGVKDDDDQTLLKEYLVYKIYNLITDKSFRVRLLNVNYNDTRGKIKPYEQYAFLIEDVDDLAKRHQCKKQEQGKFFPDFINREQATLVYMFQYMIGNTDWSVPFYHNIKLMIEKNDSLAKPYPVAYDFDMTGLVNPSYGEPHPDLGLKNLKQRLYRGYKRSLEEIEAAAKIFLEKKEAIYELINNFELLNTGNKKEMLTFLKEFFAEISNTRDLKYIFVDNALVQ